MPLILPGMKQCAGQEKIRFASRRQTLKVGQRHTFGLQKKIEWDADLRKDSILLAKP